MTPKVMLHPIEGEDSYVTPMPAVIDTEEQKIVGMKFSAGYPQNPARNLPYIDSEIILKDPETGRTYAVLGGNWVTGVRTGAATAVAADLLASPESAALGIVGAGLQARTNLRALLAVRAIRTVCVYDPNTPKAQQFSKEMSRLYGVEVNVSNDVRGVVEAMDIIVTAAPIRRAADAPIRLEWVKPQAFISALDFDSSVSGGVLNGSNTCLLTDDIEQLDSKRKEGLFEQTPKVDLELGTLVAAQNAGRSSPDQIVVFLNLGIAPSDLVVAQRAYELAAELGVGVELRPFAPPSLLMKICGRLRLSRWMNNLRRIAGCP